MNDDVLRWQIGAVTITRVEEVVVPVPAGYLITGLTDGHIAAQQPWIAPYFTDDGDLLLSVHSFLVQSGNTTIVVDTCAGVHEGRRLAGDPAFLERLASHIDGGLDGVDVVVCTHLHFDHIGWNTVLDASGERVPAFPDARYLVTADEIEGFADRDEDAVAESSIDPVVAAGLLDPVDVDHRISPEVRLVLTPGHTPGHVSVLVESDGASALITGDATHSPIQFAYPELATERVDHDSERSRQTRRDLIARYADTDMLILGTHFAPPTAGVLRSNGPGRARLVPPEG